jgi:DNA primase
MFPIIDKGQHVLAFSGRLYKDAEASQPKYINSPQTPIFTKSTVLYNLNNALETIKQSKRVVLLEGYMDVIACYRAHIFDAVASMGTSLTNQQVAQIKNLANEVVICYDGDTAGVDATKRALSMFLKAGLSVKIVQLPSGLDPDDYIEKYSEEALNQAINHEWIDTYEFYYNTTKNDVDFDKMLEIEKFKKDMFTLIKSAPNTVVDTYLNKLSLDTKLNIESIKQDFTQFTKRRVEAIDRPSRMPVNIELKYSKAERLILNYFIADIKYWLRFKSDFEDDMNDGPFFITKENRDIRFAIEDIYYNYQADHREDTSIQEDDLMQMLDPKQYTFYNNKVRYTFETLSDEEFFDFLDVFKAYKNKVEIDDINTKIKEATTIEEKVALAKKRDKLKEDFYGQR